MKRIPTHTSIAIAKMPGLGTLVILVFMLLALGACASKPIDQILLMPAPDVYDEGRLNIFTDHDPIENIPYGGILYATDRKPSTDPGKNYLDARGHVLRLGVASITAGLETMTWEEARRITLLKNRPDDYPLKVTDVRELGVLDRTVNMFSRGVVDPGEFRGTGEAFAQMVNNKLEKSTRKDIYIYVHGYKVVFENPLLVAAELWHFLGYDGVFIAYAWPSTPDRLAYASDLETASLSAGNLRILLTYLSEETTARRIHIIGYSAGTQLVTQALHQLALLHTGAGAAGKTKDLRLGHVILTGSDVDRQLFGSYLADGLLDVVDNLTVYMSEKDKALSVSRWLFRRDRLGQMWSLSPSADTVRYLRNTEALTMINVTKAEGAVSGNGHAYFRKSPWTSSDILTTLLFDLKPAQRGLTPLGDLPIWTFPENYIPRLREALVKVQPGIHPK